MLMEPKTGQNKYSVSFVYFCWTFFNQSLDLKSNILSHDICVVLIVCLRQRCQHGLVVTNLIIAQNPPTLMQIILFYCASTIRNKNEYINWFCLWSFRSITLHPLIFLAGVSSGWQQANDGSAEVTLLCQVFLAPPEAFRGQMRWEIPLEESTAGSPSSLMCPEKTSEGWRPGAICIFLHRERQTL